MRHPHGLRASAGVKNLVFVGGTAAQTTTATATPSYNINSLSGGVATAPQAGDLVIAAISFRSNTDRTIATSTAGYTEVAELYANSSNRDSQMGVYYKVLSSAETSIAFTLGNAEASTFACHVWRNQNATPLDATTTTATGTTALPNAPSITTATNNAIVIAIGSAVGDATFTLSALTVPSGMSNFFQSTITTETSIGIASYLQTTAGAYDPAVFGGGNSNSGLSFCAATLAVKPL